MLDKFVENIVDNVLDNGFSCLNSQEGEIWNDLEMKMVLDNIDIGNFDLLSFYKNINMQ